MRKFQSMGTKLRLCKVNVLKMCCTTMGLQFKKLHCVLKNLLKDTSHNRYSHNKKKGRKKKEKCSQIPMAQWTPKACRVLSTSICTLFLSPIDLFNYQQSLVIFSHLFMSVTHIIVIVSFNFYNLFQRKFLTPC